MQESKRIIRNIVLFVVLITITFIVIFKNYDLKKTIDVILSANIGYILLAFLCMWLYILFEAINIKVIIKTLGKKISILNSVKYTLIGFFFSGITPGGGGGQPMEIYYMNKDDVPVTHSTLAILIELCSFHLLTIILGIVGLLLNTEVINDGFIWIFIVGATFKFIVLAVMLIGLFSKKLSRLLVKGIIKILEKFKYKKIEEFRESANEALSQYHEGSKFIKQHKDIFIKSLIFVFLQIAANYAIVYFVYRSFGLNEVGFAKMIFIQALLCVSTTSIPLPGTVGISESAFLTIYLTIFTEASLVSGMLLSRGISFYLFMLISLIVVLLNMMFIKKKN